MKKITVLFSIIIILAIGIILWWQNGILPVDSSNKKEITFVIQEGTGLKDIASELKSQGLVRNSIVFFLYGRLGKFEGKIQAGDFRLSPSMTTAQIAEALTHGTLDVWITIPEGKRAEEVAEILNKNLPNYQPSWENDLIQNEGYLFPDTYRIPKDANIDLIISLMKDNFNKKFSELTIGPDNKFTENEIVTLASLVEREAKSRQDKLLIASVIINRINLMMPLQIDATVQYALGYSAEEKTWWRKDITLEDLNIDSPYNTYKAIGIPKGPIANPGFDSLQAIANPPDTDYLYYVSDKEGNLHFAKTLEEHNDNIKKYQVN